MKRILLVDDEEDILIPTSNILKRNDYEVIPATAGKQALELVQKHLPDLIILDLLLPDMEGTEVAFSLGNDPATQDIPIIFLTGMLTKKEELPGKQTGRRRYTIAKPVTAEELLKVIERAFKED